MWGVYLEESEGDLWSGYNVGEKKKKGVKENVTHLDLCLIWLYKVNRYQIKMRKNTYFLNLS